MSGEIAMKRAVLRKQQRQEEWEARNLPDGSTAEREDHTPTGWLPAHLRPENQGRDWRDERRTLAQPR